MNFLKSAFVAAIIFLPQPSAFAASYAYCDFNVEDYSTGQSSTMVPFEMELKTDENDFSSKDLIRVDKDDFVARIYGTGEYGRFTLSLEVRQVNGQFLPKAAASLYKDSNMHLLALVEGTNILKLECLAD